MLEVLAGFAVDVSDEPEDFVPEESEDPLDADESDDPFAAPLVDELELEDESRLSLR